MCVLFIPGGIPQHTSTDEYLCKGNGPGEQFVIKGILLKYIHKPLCTAQADKFPLLAMQLQTQSHYVPQAGIKVLSLSLLH